MTESLKDTLNKATPNTLADKFAELQLGSMFRSLINRLYMQAPVASLYQLVTLKAILLPNDVKASVIERAYARAGTGTLGELAIVGYGVTPAAGQIAVAPNGDIVTLAADAYTSVDVSYVPEKGDVISGESPVVADVLTLPQSVVGANALLTVEVTAGASLGKKIILVPSAGAPAAGKAKLSLDKTTILFAVGEATKATWTVSMVPAVNVEALLASDAVIY